MSWVAMVVLFAVVMPMMSRQWSGQRRDRLRPGDRERMEALEAELEDRLEDIRTLDVRVAELESRLDFAERLLGSGSRTPGAEPLSPGP